MLKICALCGNEKKIEPNRSTCSACRKKQSRGTLETPTERVVQEGTLLAQEEEVAEGAPEPAIDTPTPELAHLLEEARRYHIPVQGNQVWRSISGHGKDNGYWVTPHECKFGLCLNPDCKLQLT